MDFPKIKRRITHIFILASLSLFLVTPVFAVTIDITTPETTNFVPVTKPMALATPKPKEPDHVASESNTTAVVTETPTPTPSPSPTISIATPTPTATPSPTLLPTATTAPIQTVSTGSNTSTGGLNADILFDMSNNYRVGKGLAPFQKDERICSLAAKRAPEIAAEIAGGYMHAGKDSHGFPYRFTENIIEFRTEAEAFNWWINDHIHRVQIEAPNTHSCVACAGNACTQEFTSFQPK
ncbi:MAG TPA: CAP domain-containing protein [Candidatus Limnocylindrales bacterium]|nr:CAP domain-containing protein [Candidatus Limnocylindrales bacterium]